MPEPVYTAPPNDPPSLGQADFSSRASGFLGWLPVLGNYISDVVTWFGVTFLKLDAISKRFFEVSDATNAWIIGENIKGDTSCGVGEVRLHTTRIGNVAFINLSAEIVNFDQNSSSTDNIVFSLDLAAIGVESGHFTSISANNLGDCYGRFSGAFGLGSYFSMAASAGTDGLLDISSADTSELPTQASNATQLEVQVSIVLLVED